MPGLRERLDLMWVARTSEGPDPWRRALIFSAACHLVGLSLQGVPPESFDRARGSLLLSDVIHTVSEVVFEA